MASPDKLLTPDEIKALLKIAGIQKQEAPKVFGYSRGGFNHFLQGTRPCPITFDRFKLILIIHAQTRVEKLSILTREAICQEG